MDPKTGAELLQAMWRKTEADESRFLEIIDSIQPPLRRDVISLLFETYLPIDDFGTQESVYSKLAHADRKDYFAVLAVQLLELIERSPEHGEVIILQNAVFHPAEIAEAILQNGNHDIGKILEFMRGRLSSEDEVKILISRIESRNGK